MFFNSDSFLYVLFRDFKNGIEIDYPKWPGINTKLHWSFNDELNVKLCVNGTSNQLFINGDVFLEQDMPNLSGQVGLRYLRFYEVSFKSFSIDYDRVIGVRNAADYDTYVQEGGNLIVLNTIGNGYFANKLFTPTNSTISINRIHSDFSDLLLPENIEVPLILAKDSGNIISGYAGIEGDSPFILTKNYENGGQIMYVNIYPIMNNINQDSSEFYPILGGLIENANLSKIAPSNPLSEFNGFLKEIELGDKTRIETNSLLFSPESPVDRVEINSNSSLFFLDNITMISLDGYSKVVVETDEVITQAGHGLYTEFLSNLPLSIIPKEDQFKITIVSSNQTISYYKVDSLSIVQNSKFNFYAKTPTIITSNANFIEFYLQNYQQSTDLIDGQNLTVTGSSKFSIPYADTYYSISNLTLASSFKPLSHIFQFDFISTLPLAVFWSLLLIPIFIGGILIFILKSSRSIKPINKNQKNETQ